MSSDAILQLWAINPMEDSSSSVAAKLGEVISLCNGRAPPIVRELKAKLELSPHLCPLGRDALVGYLHDIHHALLNTRIPPRRDDGIRVVGSDDVPAGMSLFDLMGSLMGGLDMPVGRPPAREARREQREPTHEDTPAEAGQPTCIACHTNRPNTVMVPCGHLNLCWGCSGNVDRCPTCRAPSTRTYTYPI